MSFTPEMIERLQPNEVFVFGSNINGQHCSGAARTAYEHFGAFDIPCYACWMRHCWV